MGSLLSLLHCKVQRRNIKTLRFDGNGEYTFLFVSGVQSSLRKNKTEIHISKAKKTLDMVIFALQGKNQDVRTSRLRYFVATLFSLAGDDRV